MYAYFASWLPFECGQLSKLCTLSRFLHIVSNIIQTCIVDNSHVLCGNVDNFPTFTQKICILTSYYSISNKYSLIFINISVWKCG